MSTTATIHFVCDVCGKRADVEQRDRWDDVIPDGWRSSVDLPYGLFCSLECARKAAVLKAEEMADRLFVPMEVQV